MSGKVFENSIDGVEMQATMIFNGLYFGKTKDETIKISLGTCTLVRWNTSKSGEQKFRLDKSNAVAYADGVEITNGDMMFRVLNEDNIALIYRKLVQNKLKKKTSLTKYKASPFISSATVQLLSESESEEANSEEFNLEELDWTTLPFFDILMTAKMEDNKQVSVAKIKGISITSIGDSESVDSTEKNEIISFLSLGNVDDFKIKSYKGGKK